MFTLLVLATMALIAGGDVTDSLGSVCGGVWASPVNTALLVLLAVVQTTRHKQNQQELEANKRELQNIREIIKEEVSSQLPGGNRKTDPPPKPHTRRRKTDTAE